MLKKLKSQQENPNKKKEKVIGKKEKKKRKSVIKKGETNYMNRTYLIFRALRDILVMLTTKGHLCNLN